MTYQDILVELKQKKLSPIYFFEGDEPYFIDQISDYILDNVLSEDDKGFNQTLLYGKDVSIDTILTAARRYPMMAERQVVVIREAQNIKNIEELSSYFEHPQPSTLLVVCYKYKTIDKRKKLYKSLLKNGVYFESKTIYENQVPSWITSYLKDLNLGIEPLAAQLIADHVGNNLQRIVNDLDKVVFSAKPGTRITVDDVQKNIGISKEYNPFEFQTALGNRDVFKANRIVNYFIDNEKNNSIQSILSILTAFYRKILVYHSIEDKSNRNEVGQQLGVNPYFINDYVTAARNYPLNISIGIISLIREFDLRSKGARGGSTSNSELLRELTYKILHS